MQNFIIKNNNRLTNVSCSHFPILSLFFIAASFLFTNVVLATEDTRAQAKRIHDRLTGVVPSSTVLDKMEGMLDGTVTDANYPGGTGAIAAAYVAMDNKYFYNATLVNFITPWTNEARSVFPEDMGTEGILNDYTATVIGAVRDEIDFRRILYDNILYKGKTVLAKLGGGTIATYSNDNNEHYKELEERPDLNLKNDLIPESEAVQSTITGLDGGATAGVLTSRAGAKAFFVGGTNRAMFRFTMLNHLCKDMEQVTDVTLPADRIRQDVSRSPGGDSRIFMNGCIGCHTGMDPMTQAFAYYDYTYPTVGGEPVYEDGQLLFNNVGQNDLVTGSRVTEKNQINPDNFKPGFIVEDDSWINYWREGKNSLLGWSSTPLTDNDGKGAGAKSMGQELAYSEQFARCQVEKVFKAVCLRPPSDSNDRDAVDAILTKFKAPFNNPSNTEGYELKRVFAETAVYCKGQ